MNGASGETSTHIDGEMVTEMGNEMTGEMREVRICVTGRDGGRGTMTVSSVGTDVMSIVGIYTHGDGSTARYAIRRSGVQYEEMSSHKQAATPEALLPLVIRCAPWDIERDA